MAVGVRVIVSVSMVFPEFSNVNAGIDPVPVDVNPVRLPKEEVAVQLMLVFATGVLGVTAADVPPEQICSNRGFRFTTGFGCTVTVISIGVPGQLIPALEKVGVTV